MTVTNITDFRANAKQYIDNVINDNSALVINRGKTAAVLISLDEYNSIKETERLMYSREYDAVKETGLFDVVLLGVERIKPVLDA